MRLQIVISVVILVLIVDVKGQDSTAKAECQKCHNIFDKWKNVVNSVYQNNFADLLKKICTEISDDSPLCFALHSELAPIIYRYLGQIKPNQICALIVGNCGQLPEPIVEPIELPPKPKNKIPIDNCGTEKGKTFRFLQISDLHIEYKYTVGAEADCCKSVVQCAVHDCCVDNPPPGQEAKMPAEYWGTLAACDIPYRTAESLFQHLPNHQKRFDFAILSGDYASHRALGYTKIGHKQLIANLSALISNHLPNTPFYWTLGNHEGVPLNQFAPHYVKIASLRPQWVYAAIWRAGKQFLPGTAKKSAIYRGSYSAYIRPHLKMISLNTGYCLKSNFWMYLGTTDPDETFAWLIKELADLETKGHFAYILGHIPPGYLENKWYDECFDSWSRNYVRVVNRFSGTINGQFFGHTHTDSFKMFYDTMDDPNSTPTNVMFITPSLTTSFGLNPAYRIYTADAATGRILDFETHFLNLTKANSLVPGEKPSWEFLYSAKEEYGLKSMEPASFNELIGRIEKEKIIGQKFVKNFFRRDDMNCDEKCMREIVCGLRSAHKNMQSFCPDINF